MIDLFYILVSFEGDGYLLIHKRLEYKFMNLNVDFFTGSKGKGILHFGTLSSVLDRVSFTIFSDKIEIQNNLGDSTIYGYIDVNYFYL